MADVVVLAGLLLWRSGDKQLLGDAGAGQTGPFAPWLCTAAVLEPLRRKLVLPALF